VDSTLRITKIFVAAILYPLLACPAQAALSSRQKTIEDLGTGVAIALPVIAGGITLYKHDRKDRRHRLCLEELRA